MRIPREKKKEEAIRRMKSLKYFNPSINEFRRSNKVMVNEPPFGAHYYIDGEPDLVQAIEDFERDNDALVYAVVRAILKDGFGQVYRMDSLLYVEDYEEEWEYFDEDIKENIIMSYTINWTDPEFSEFGSIRFKRTGAAGILRDVS